MKKFNRLFIFTLCFLFGNIAISVAQIGTGGCNNVVDAEILTPNTVECALKTFGVNADDPDNPNNVYTWYVDNVVVEGPTSDDKLDYIFPCDGTYSLKLKIELNGCASIEIITVNITNCGSCDPPNCCDIDTDFNASVTNCNEYFFDGFNNGTSCFSQTHKWEVNGTLVGTSEDLNYTFTNGTYTVCYTITELGGTQRECSNTYCETIVVNCGGGPCPNASNIHYINEGGGGQCTTGQASVNGINTSNVDYVDWTWALGGYSGTINGAGTTTPIYYPSGNWTGSYISICATVVYDNGDVCPQVCKSFLLDCGQGGGGQQTPVMLVPNPATSTFSVVNTSETEVIKVNIRNIYGALIKSIRDEVSNEVNMSNEREGVYFVEVIFADGSTVIKKLILE